MARRVQMSVDPDFKDVVRNMKKDRPGMSDREMTKEIANGLTGRSLFDTPKTKKKGRGNEIIFNL